MNGVIGTPAEKRKKQSRFGGSQQMRLLHRLRPSQLYMPCMSEWLLEISVVAVAKPDKRQRKIGQPLKSLFPPTHPIGLFCRFRLLASLTLESVQGLSDAACSSLYSEDICTRSLSLAPLIFFRFLPQSIHRTSFFAFMIPHVCY